MLHDVVHSVVSDSGYALSVHLSGLLGEAKSVHPVDVDWVSVQLLLKRNFRPLSTELLELLDSLKVVRTFVEVLDFKVRLLRSTSSSHGLGIGRHGLLTLLVVVKGIQLHPLLLSEHSKFSVTDSSRAIGVHVLEKGFNVLK